MKKIVLSFVVLLLITVLTACTQDIEDTEDTEEYVGYAGEYIGYSWNGETNGITFDETTQYIETKMILDDDGIILEFEMDFKVKRDDVWISRLDQTSVVSIDYEVVPTVATLGDTFINGTSMFTVQTQDFMSFYAYGVNSAGVVALAIVDPITRFMFEMRLESSFDYSTKLSELNVGNGGTVPTIRTSSSGYSKPTSWETYEIKNVFNIHSFSYVITDTGVFEGITQNSTVRQLLESLDIQFINDVPQEMAASYGYYGLGGWKGNYEAIAQSLIGKNATQMTSLIDWSIERYALGINDDNQFGIDVQAGGTRTIQESYDTISGATVRVSRESTSFQRALLDAGIITQNQIIIGRF